MGTPTVQHPTPTEPPKLGAAAIMARLIVFVLMLNLPFLAAGHLDWPQGVTYLALMLIFVGGSRILMARKYPDLVTERLRAGDLPDSKQWDKPLSAIIGLWGVLATWIVAGLDKRFGWPPPIPIELQVIVLIVYVLGTLFGTWALLVNRFFSAVVRIQHDRGHSVVTSGPHRLVRHPGYAAGVIGYLVMPFLLNSLWAMIPAALAAILIIIRTALEDRTLQEELSGYREYAARVRYRLLPGVW